MRSAQLTPKTDTIFLNISFIDHRQTYMQFNISVVQLKCVFLLDAISNMLGGNKMRYRMVSFKTKVSVVKASALQTLLKIIQLFHKVVAIKTMAISGWIWWLFRHTM